MPDEQQKQYIRKVKDGDGEIIEAIDASKEDYDNWMNIDTAVAVLGKGDRQVRRYIVQFNWPTRWLKEDGRVKTFIMKEHVLKFLEKKKAGEIDDKDDEEQAEKQQPQVPDKPENSSALDLPLFAAVKQVSAELSMTLPELIKDYKTINDTVHKLSEEKTHISNQVVRWKTSTVWIGIISVVICGIVGFNYYDSRSELINHRTAVTSLQKEKDNLKDTVKDTEIELIERKHAIEGLQQSVAEKSSEIQKLEKKVYMLENPNLRDLFDSAVRLPRKEEEGGQ
jgi:hypothetical protein